MVVLNSEIVLKFFLSEPVVYPSNLFLLKKNTSDRPFSCGERLLCFELNFEGLLTVLQPLLFGIMIDFFKLSSVSFTFWISALEVLCRVVWI
jgi:hypothetical protein